MEICALNIGEGLITLVVTKLSVRLQHNYNHLFSKLGWSIDGRGPHKEYYIHSNYN